MYKKFHALAFWCLFHTKICFCITPHEMYYYKMCSENISRYNKTLWHLCVKVYYMYCVLLKWYLTYCIVLQIPIFEVRSDGIDNFLSSLLIAGNFVIPEVTVFFNYKLLRGNRTTKVSSESFAAFDSPNTPPPVSYTHLFGWDLLSW